MYQCAKNAFFKSTILQTPILIREYYNISIAAIQSNTPDKDIDILQYIATFIAFKVGI